MAHFAELDETDTVLRVIVVHNDVLKDANGEESEALGVAFCEKLFGGGRWAQCSYNGNKRKNYPGPGYKYDRTRGGFIAPKKFESWTLNPATLRWEPPVARPQGDGNLHKWNEAAQRWDVVNAPA